MNDPEKVRLTVAEVNALGREDFVDKFGAVFEHAPWIAEQTWEARPFDNRMALMGVMQDTMLAADRQAKLRLIHAHPELAGKAAAAGELTEHSSREQHGAGLDTCTVDELAKIRELNAAYRHQFGMPFIVAVKGLTKHDILAVLESRLKSTHDVEFNETLWQICKIAALRIAELVGND